MLHQLIVAFGPLASNSARDVVPLAFGVRKSLPVGWVGSISSTTRHRIRSASWESRTCDGASSRRFGSCGTWRHPRAVWVPRIRASSGAIAWIGGGGGEKDNVAGNAVRGVVIT